MVRNKVKAYFPDDKVWVYLDFDMGLTNVDLVLYNRISESRIKMYKFINKQDLDGNDVYEGDIIGVQVVENFEKVLKNHFPIEWVDFSNGLECWTQFEPKEHFKIAGHIETNPELLIKDNKVKIPNRLHRENFTHTIKLATKYINELAKPEDERQLKDIEQYIFEASIEAVYGAKVWDYINQRLE